MKTPAGNAARDFNLGLFYALIALIWWGMATTIYFKILGAVPILEIMAHRVVWSFLLAAAIITGVRSWRPYLEAWSQPQVLLLLLLSMGMMIANWGVFIYAVTSDQIVAASLGAFINPLISVAMGMIFLRERLRPLQKIACLIAILGVVILTVQIGELPWIALSLAITFSAYGFIRKIVQTEALVGYMLESSLYLAPAVGYLLWLTFTHEISFSSTDIFTDALLLGAGIVTALPLITFAAAARKLPLSILGVMQFIAPVCTLLVGVLMYDEPFTWADALPFGIIWVALVIHAGDLVLLQREMSRAASAAR